LASVRRGLLDILTVVSLLVAMAAAGVWVRGFFWMDLVRVHRMDWDVKHNQVPQSQTYVISAWGRVMWSGRVEVPRNDDVYLQRDFELHWQAGPLPPGDTPREGIWLGWVVMSGVALPAGRVGVWAWRRKRGGQKSGGDETRRRARGAYGLRVAAVLAWAAGGAAVVLAVGWGRSYPFFERVDWKLWSEHAGVQVNSSRGSLMLAWTNKGPDRMIKRHDFAFIRTCEPPTRGPLYQAADLVPPYVQMAGFTLGTDGSTAWPYNVLIVPYWFVEGVLLGLGLLAWRYVRRQSKRAEGQLCARCGYDMRATPDRCPECGLEAIKVVSPVS
jgi:hypothetical protein